MAVFTDISAYNDSFSSNDYPKYSVSQLRPY